MNTNNAIDDNSLAVYNPATPAQNPTKSMTLERTDLQFFYKTLKLYGKTLQPEGATPVAGQQNLIETMRILRKAFDQIEGETKIFEDAKGEIIAKLARLQKRMATHQSPSKAGKLSSDEVELKDLENSLHNYAHAEVTVLLEDDVAEFLPRVIAAINGNEMILGEYASSPVNLRSWLRIIDGVTNIEQYARQALPDEGKASDDENGNDDGSTQAAENDSAKADTTVEGSGDGDEQPQDL